MWESNRQGADKGGGGLTLLYRNTLNTHEYNPTVSDEYKYVMKERQWLLVSSGSNRCAFLHVYIACQNSRNNSYLQWNEDLFSLLTQEALELKRQGFFVLAMGDFNSRIGNIPGLENNSPDHNRNTPRFLRFIEEVNLVIINTLPVSEGLFTRFDDVTGGKSLLDYALIDSEKTDIVNTLVIDEDARFRCGSDHALLHCTIEFHHRPKGNWQFKKILNYNLQSSTDYNMYRRDLNRALSSKPLCEFSLETPAAKLLHITECIHSAATNSIGFKVTKRKKGRRLPQNLLSMIHERNELVQHLGRCSSCSILEHQMIRKNIAEIKEKLNGELLAHKLKKRATLRSKLLLKDPTRKKFWRYVKGQMNLVGRITAIKDKSGKMVFDREGIQDVILNHFSDVFSGQQIPVYEKEVVPEITDELSKCPGERKFESDHFEDIICAPYSYNELDEILSQLKTGKACGHDRYESSFGF